MKNSVPGYVPNCHHSPGWRSYEKKSMAADSRICMERSRCGGSQRVSGIYIIASEWERWV